jgi:hypothetical protein
MFNLLSRQVLQVLANILEHDLGPTVEVKLSH